MATNHAPAPSQRKHTPGPWRSCMYADHIPNFVIKPVGGSAHLAKVNYFAGSPENAAVNDITEGEANAQFIVTACNAHYDLLAYAEGESARTNGNPPPWGHKCSDFKMAHGNVHPVFQ